MKYLMLVCTDPNYTPGQDDGAPDVEDWVSEMDGKGIRLMGSRTRPAGDATMVRVRNRETLLTDGPYNTYTRAGLPPGPIASPGLDAIDAVLHPTKNPYLYFLTASDGTVVYASTFDEHVANKQRYLR